MRSGCLSLLLSLVAVGLFSPAAAQAATCADYSNQADAQRAMDTRDADGDGIYCESLPCPCLKPGQSSGGGGPSGSSSAQECGVERVTVKTLSDSRAGRVSFAPRDSTVARLRRLAVPNIGRHSPRQPGEFTTYRLKVRLRSFKVEEDSDIHLVVSDPTDPVKTMIVELPNRACTANASSTARAAMATARRALLRACGQPGRSTFTLLSGRATITGVAFFDLLHGQRGVAPNGIELHPLIGFKETSGCGD